MGYHKSNIKRGEIGEISKVIEEVDEFVDAKQQGIKILEICELSDIYGALEELAKKYNLTMDDLKQMSDKTKEAFKEGKR